MTGASGYIGGRLVPELLARGHRVRCLVRNPGRLRDQPWRADVDIAVGDVSRPETLAEAFDGVDVAYYLVHSLGTGPAFEATDRAAAHAFGAAAAAAGAPGSSTLAVSSPPGCPKRTSRPICGPAPRSAESCAAAVCPRPNCVRP